MNIQQDHRGAAWERLYLEGMSATDAAYKRGMTISAACKWAEYHGLSWSTPPENRQPVAQSAPLPDLADLHAQGLTMAQAMKVRRCSAHAAWKWADDHGVSWASPDDVVPLMADAGGEIDPRACRTLWAAVLMNEWACVFTPRAVMDDQHDRARAQKWFGGKDFQMVCALAGADSDFIMRRFREALAARSSAEAVQGPRRSYRRVWAGERVA